MKLVTFTGDANGDGPAAVSLWGYEFPKGVAVEVADPAAIAKAEGNSHFKVAAKRGRRKNGEDGE